MIRAGGASCGVTQRLLALLTAAALAGCATVPDEQTAAATSPAAPSSVPSSAAAKMPAPAAADAQAPATPQSEAQPHLFALDPFRPSVIIDGDDPAARTDLWVRVRKGFAMADLDNELVVKWQQWYASRPDYVQRMTERGGRYLFYVVAAAVHRERVQSAGALGGARVGNVAVHARHRQGLRSQAEPLP